MSAIPPCHRLRSILSKQRTISTIAMLMLLAACPSPRHSPGIRIGLPEEPVTLDPRRATDAVSSRICRLLYRRLVDFNAAYRPVPALATWEQPEPLLYRFTLGTTGRKFHNNTRLNADDVKATYEWILHPENASPHLGSLQNIKRITVIDVDTLEFQLSRADPMFPGRLTHGILPAEQIHNQHPFHEQPIGSGPIRYLSRNSQGIILLQRIRDGQQFHFIPVREPITRLLKLARGELDLVQGSVPPELIVWARQQPQIHVLQHPGNVFTYLGFNLQHPVTGELRIREAIAHALDRDVLSRQLMQGRARPSEQLMPPDHWAAHPTLPAHSHNLQRARTLLAEAGYGPDNPARIEYKTSSDPFRIRLATAIAHQLGQAGIQVTIRSADWGVFYGDIKAGRFQMYSLSWVGLRLPDIYRYAFHSASTPPHGANRGRLEDPTVDHLIDVAEASGQANDYQRLQEQLHDILPYVPLWHENHILLTRKGIQGYTLNAQGNYDGLLTIRTDSASTTAQPRAPQPR